jgi:glucose/arabinose dehydrogenase/PKD repeat protein
VFASAAANAWAVTVPVGFEDTLVTKITGPTAVTFAPDGRMLATGKAGILIVFKDGLQTTALDITAKTCSDKERGLLGVAVDPAFTTNHYIYLYYTFKKLGNCDYNSASGPVNRLSRFVLADNNVVNPASETVLIDNIPQPDGIHNAGDLHFGKDGFLYVTVGDGGCDYAGDSGCGSSNDAARDLNALVGKVLRITSTGGIPATNPYQGSDSARCNLAGRTDPGKKCQEIFATGLRNPWRAAFDPNASGTRFFINDVGNNTWEEVDLGQVGADYGWNIREGHCLRNSSTDCPPPPAGLTDPIYDYNHSTGCTSITGGAFVPNGIWPAAFDNTYLYGDFVCGKIIRLTPQQTGGFTASDFVTGLGTSSITSMQFGPYGSTQALYYMNFLNGGEVRRIAFIGTANRAPTAVASANPTSGPAPLTVSFDGSGSTDPDGDALTYEWDFGDGTPHASGAKVSHTYTNPGTFTATLTVRDGRGGVGTATVRIDSGNAPPTPTITSPAATDRFAVGQEITLTGSATDPEDGPLPDSALSWTVIKHHDTHVHPFLPPTTGNNVKIIGPEPEDFAATTTTYLEIQLTATDSRGLTTTVVRNMYPKLVDLTFQTSPSGLRLDVAGVSLTAPQTVKSWEAWQIGVNAPDQVDGSGNSWTFDTWSDGGTASHAIITPPVPATYTATFKKSETQTFTFLPDADSRVYEANPTTNYGTSDHLRVDADPDVQSYLRFTVSGVSGTVQSAKLRLYSYSGTKDGPAAYGTSNSWSETGITWNNRPPPTTGAIDDKGAIPDNSVAEYELKPLVTGNGTYSFALVGSSSDGVSFWSRTGAVKPELVLTVTPSSTPPPVTTATFFPDADARVYEASPTTNFGTSAYLRVDGGADPDVQSYLRFTVSGVSGTVQSAKLRLYSYSGTKDGPAAYGTSNSWSETGITWSNRPPPTTGAIDDKGAIPDNTVAEYELKPLVTGNGTYSFILAGTSSDGVYFWSRTGTVKPELVLTLG